MEVHAWVSAPLSPFSLRTSFELLLVSACSCMHPISIRGERAESSQVVQGAPGFKSSAMLCLAVQRALERSGNDTTLPM